MKNFADRYKVYSGVEICNDNAEGFLNDLIKTGYVERVE